VKYSLVFACLFFVACKTERSGKELEEAVLKENGFIKDRSSDSLLRFLFRGVNCIASGEAKLVLSKDYHLDSTHHILVIPILTSNNEYKSSAYSDVAKKFVLINMGYIRDFVNRHALNDTTAFEGTASMILLHELGHFALGKEGAHDRIDTISGNSPGEVKNFSTPEYITSIKKVELQADSIAMSWVKTNIGSQNMDCYACATDIQIMLPGMYFNVFGMRTIAQFGQPQKILRDPSSTHPNMELRIAFMNYFLMPTEQMRQTIEQYLYDREVAPIHNQEFDPRIYQGQEKVLNE